MAPGPTPLVRDARTALERAQREFERGRMREAIDLLEQAVALDPRSAAARVLLGVAYARTHRIEPALQHLEAALALEPNAFAPRCALGELYLRLGIPEQARQHLHRALEHASNAAERAYAHSLLKEDRARERRRAPRPDFGEPFWLLRRRRARERQ